MAKNNFRGMGGGGGNNMNAMLKQAQKMQENVMKKQEELNDREFEASAGGGVITAKVNGKKELLSISIKPEVVDPDDIEMLEDLIIAAVNEAISTADETVSSELGKMTGGLNLGF